ncbi:MAG TPA: hypothetical protein PLP55_08195 [Phycicoccus elongatus]|uniref:hypothetical protein n=1 Tax=Phycicoccus TaxID=367298 RepID=UPI0025830633|nr:MULTISPECIES: hypothetical protein [Phycicoccus]MCO5303852.1 hypothetical protein [Phycicoccus sp.]HPF76114.1 hypothetical protein [Phycicoccus elongatus]HPK12654.1 hypothetical protein [Phycicoccus elongatus]HPQ73787.1 hypothetical protein [Phycicoccus elongatus]HRV57316.1 hypothetical protein [Phycicoccus sp.]
MPTDQPGSDGLADGFDPREALGLIEAESRRTRAALDTRIDEILIAWGLAWLIGLGVLWWQGRVQDPFTGPTAATGILFTTLLLAAGGWTGHRTNQATRGLGGESAFRGIAHGWSWGLGFGGLFVLIGGLARAGATPEQLSLLSTCGALVVTGVMYAATAATWGTRPALWLGVWLVVVGAVGAFAGPLWALGLGAVAGGGALLAVGLWLRARRGH